MNRPQAYDSGSAPDFDVSCAVATGDEVLFQSAWPAIRKEASSPSTLDTIPDIYPPQDEKQEEKDNNKDQASHPKTHN